MWEAQRGEKEYLLLYADDTLPIVLSVERDQHRDIIDMISFLLADETYSASVKALEVSRLCSHDLPELLVGRTATTLRNVIRLLSLFIL